MCQRKTIEITETWTGPNPRWSAWGTSSPPPHPQQFADSAGRGRFLRDLGPERGLERYRRGGRGREQGLVEAAAGNERSGGKGGTVKTGEGKQTALP